MSTTILDPTVVRKLRHFGRRRFHLLLLRGLCAGIVTFLLCMAAVALIDWYWVLTDQTRWIASISAYVLTAIAIWMTSLRKIVRSVDREEIATHVEAAEPELRENLLSAVELATDDPEGVHDSPVFRGLLQGKVAEQMATLRVPRLLPYRMMAKWMFAAIALIAGVAFVLTLPDPRFRTLAARAIMPGANIDRVSRIHVDILQPTPNSQMVAKDETVAVVVEISGGNVDEVILETFTADDEPKQQSMRARTDEQFAANIHVVEDVDYRILAGDAVTRKHSIAAKGRPKVDTFHKTYTYPEYSGLAHQTVTEDHGDIVVLEGTRAELELELDQPVKVAELRINAPNSDDVTTIPLARQNNGRWAATVPVEEAAIYKIHLVSEETGFENIFSPRYEIRPVPDLIPRAGFVDQQEMNLLLPPNDILNLKGMAEDDLPVAALEQEISINGRDWIAIPLETTPAETETTEADANTSAVEVSRNRITSHWDWDLLGYKLKTGDQVSTRLVATDLKGNRGESVPLRIVVSAPDFDPDRHAIMELKAGLYDRFAELRKLGEESKKTAHEILKRLKADHKKGAKPRPEEEQALDRTNLADLADSVQESSVRLLADIREVTRSMPAGADAYDLNLSGRVIARLAHEHCNTPDFLLKAIQATEDRNETNKYLDETRKAFDRIADDAKTSAYHYQHMMTYNIAAAVSGDFEALYKQQQLVVNSPTQTWSRLVRQETVVLNQLRVVEKLLQTQNPRLSGHLHNHLKSLLQWTRERQNQLEAATESEDKLPELQRLSQSLSRELKDRQRADAVDGNLATRLTQARTDFENRGGNLIDPLNGMINASREETKLLIAASDAEDSTKAEEITKKSLRFAAEIDLKIRPALDQLRIRRELVQARVDGDAQYAADAGLTHRAVNFLMNQYRQGDPKESIVPKAFSEIGPAYRILESAHQMKNVQTTLDNLIQLERWGSQGLAAKMDHPRQWDLIKKGMETGVNWLRWSGVPKDIMTKFDQVRWSNPVNEAERKIGQRRWVRKDPVAAGYDLVELRDLLNVPSAELKPVMAEARAVIAKYAPTIPQMAQQAADQIRELEEQTADAADEIEKAKTEQPDDAQKTENSEQVKDEPAPQIADLQDKQERINQQIDDLFEALVEDANKQDLLKEEERERARDADDSIAMVQDPAEQMNEALDEAEESPTAEQQAKDLAKAAEKQEETAQALEKVAQHFEKLEQNIDVAESRAELRQQEREMGIARQMDQKFEPIEQLADRAQQSPTDLLEALEEELKQNPAMREALSEIAQNTIQEARGALEDAAKKDQDIQRANERSDKDFQEKKKELSKDIRDLGQDARNLANRLVAQAKSIAGQAKTPDAQKKFSETQKKLNEAADAATRANEGELQADLAKKLNTAKDAIQDATKLLAEAKDKAAEGKGNEIYADAKTRENARKSLERQRKQFIDQRKREADSVTRRFESRERQVDQQIRNAENQLRNEERRVDQAKKQLKRKPDDKNLKRNVQRAEQRRDQAKDKVRQEKKQKEAARRETQDARKARKEVDKIPRPALKDKNPAAQLAEDYAEQAKDVADDLKRKAEELAKNMDFGEELNANKDQLANAAKQQEAVKKGVLQTAENIARAARHEKRLEKDAVAKAVQQSADDVEQVANNEVTQAKAELSSATEAAKEASEAEGEAGNKKAQTKAAQKTQQANKAVAQSEAALSAQADALTEILEPMQEAQAAAAAGEPTGQPEGGQEPGNQKPGQQPDGQQPGEQSGQEPSGQPGGQSGQPGSPSQGSGTGDQPQNASTPPQSFTLEETAAGQQLAQVLDELDQMQASAAEMAGTEGQQTGQQSAQPTPAQPSSLLQAAKAAQAQMAAARALAQQQTALSKDATGFSTDGIPAYDGDTGEVVVVEVSRDDKDDWGKLREQAAEDLTKGRSEAVSEEYRKSVETYFRVLAERARRKNK